MEKREIMHASEEGQGRGGRISGKYFIKWASLGCNP